MHERNFSIYSLVIASSFFASVWSSCFLLAKRCKMRKIWPFKWHTITWTSFWTWLNENWLVLEIWTHAVFHSYWMWCIFFHLCRENEHARIRCVLYGNKSHWICWSSMVLNVKALNGVCIHSMHLVCLALHIKVIFLVVVIIKQRRKFIFAFINFQNVTSCQTTDKHFHWYRLDYTDLFGNSSSSVGLRAH